MLLALVLREESTDGGPNQNLVKKTKQHQPQQAKRGKQTTKTSSTKRVRKTIQKRQSAARSQSNSAAQRRRALQAITQATANGRPADKPKKRRTTYKTGGQNAPGPAQIHAIEDDLDAMQQDPERNYNQPDEGHSREPRYSIHLEDQPLQTSPPKAPRYGEPMQHDPLRHLHPRTAQRQPLDHQTSTADPPIREQGRQAANGQQLPVPLGTTPTGGVPPALAGAPPRLPTERPGERDVGGPTIGTDSSHSLTDAPQPTTSSPKPQAANQRSA